MKKLVIQVVLVVAAMLLVSCVAGPNGQVDTPSAAGLVAGFWRGLWHGIIAPFTFLVSLFSDHVHMYEVHNNGGWYDFGFLLGLTSVHGGGHAARSRSRRRRDAAA
jgi:hypothetical protein